jgi:phosphatidate cytidylyltransferase
MDFPPRPSSRSAPRTRRDEPPEEWFEAASAPAEEGLDESAEGGEIPAFAREDRATGEFGGIAAEEAGEPPARRAAAPRRRGGRRIRSETLARVLWVIPWLVFAVTVVAAGGTIFAVAMTGLAWAALIEFFRMTARARPFQLAAFGAAAGMILAAHFGDSFQMLLVGVAFFPVMLGFALARGDLHNVTWALAVTVFGVVWIAVPFAHAVLLRDLPLHGGALLVDVLVATFFTDTFAYVGGRSFGQRPLAPMVSPNKTVEGLVIGIAGGVLGFWLAGLYQDWLSGPEALLFGLCIALLAPLGDLFESIIKRDLDVKDTGRMLGPHGGLLDRLDAVLFTVVAGYYLALAIVV